MEGGCRQVEEGSTKTHIRAYSRERYEEASEGHGQRKRHRTHVGTLVGRTGTHTRNGAHTWEASLTQCALA